MVKFLHIYCVTAHSDKNQKKVQMPKTQQFTRNFAIIAHIDHGKSTLADRIMETTNTVSNRESSDQLLDDLAVEQMHGVTVKSRTVRNYYVDPEGQEFEYNLIDTPGHVDFNYEVSRSLSATDGVLLLVDATKGVQAQTVANYRLAQDAQLTVIPIINKIDNQMADVEKTQAELIDLDDRFTPKNTLKISAKTGIGIDDVLLAIRDRLPSPSGDPQAPLKGLIFDTKFDPYQGVLVQARIFDGTLTKDMALNFMAQNVNAQPKEIGFYTPLETKTPALSAGDVGYIMTGIKDAHAIHVGDTVTSKKAPTDAPFPGYQTIEPMVYAGIYPHDGEYKELKIAIEKLALNDAAFQYEPEQSEALGIGFRGGFLGIFHLQIIRERLQAEFGLDVLTTMPNSTYRVSVKNQDKPLYIENPTQFPDYNLLTKVEEPYVRAKITAPDNQLNDIMRLAENRRGVLQDLETIGDMLLITYKMPISEIAYDFFNELKSVSHGFATLSTERDDYDESDLVRLDIQIDYTAVDALTFVMHRLRVDQFAQEIVQKLTELVPRKLQQLTVQAVVEGRVISRGNIPPLRKAAASSSKTSKKQQQMRRQGQKNQVELPQSVFDAILDMNRH